MYKRIVQNILTTTRKTSIKLNSLKYDGSVSLFTLNEIQAARLTQQFVQNRNYKRLLRDDSSIDDLIKELSQKSNEEVDEISTIIIAKDNEAAQKKIDEFRQDPENDKYYKSLELQLDWWRQDNRRVPSQLKPFEMLQLLQFKGIRKIKYLQYLFLNEKKREINEQKQIERRKSLEEYRLKRAEKRELEMEEEEIKYSLSHNSMFLRIYTTTINRMYNNNVIKSIMFGNKLILDCSYDKYMSPSDISSCSKQMMVLIGNNRVHDRPFYLHFCNAKKNSPLMQKFKNHVPTLYNDDYPVYITEESYLDIFDKKDLCYLTPHCRTDLMEYDPNTTYIIGAFVDKTSKQPLSMAKAKREGIRMAKLPIEKFVDWGPGSSKNLTLHTCADILLDIQVGNDWAKAMNHLPTRKLRASREYVMQRQLEYNMRKQMENNQYNIAYENTPLIPKKTPINYIPKEEYELKKKELRQSKESNNEDANEEWRNEVKKKMLEESFLQNIESKRMEKLSRIKSQNYNNEEMDQNNLKADEVENTDFSFELRSRNQTWKK